MLTFNFVDILMKEVLKYPYKASTGIQYPFGGFFNGENDILK
jgi:hypothetical protein